MTTDKTLQKADAALSILIKYDEKNYNGGFRKVLDEILDSWMEI
jgi:hypothetical protein